MIELLILVDAVDGKVATRSIKCSEARSLGQGPLGRREGVFGVRVCVAVVVS